MEDRILENVAQAEMLCRGFARMTTWQRFVLILHLHGITCTRIAEGADVSIAAVNKVKHEAIRKLREAAL